MALDVTGGLRALLPTIRYELTQRDTTHPVFHGSWDWHSSVHGHWAALAAGAHLGDDATVEWVAARLSAPPMLAELDLLDADPSFERPYGRAWLLRLLATYEQVTNRRELHERGQRVADGLRGWLADPDLAPHAAEYANPCWALLQLHHWSDHAGDESTLSWIRLTVEARWMAMGPGLARDHEAGEFFSAWALQTALIGQTLGDEVLTEWLRDQPLEPGALSPIQTPRSAHHLGMNASRAWGFWAAYCATDDAAWRDAYRRHVAASLALHDDWRADRHAYAHWVPQFAVYALLLSTSISNRAAKYSS